MILDIVKIGNSKGVRLPKTLLDGITSSKVVAERKGDSIILKPCNPREGWVEQIKKVLAEEKNKKDEDMSMFEDITNEFDEEEWTW
ncbi:MAG: AbrB/MazE/SpoVT family DNA-binding domain-containing protein [Deltaproteobacteria bacterium]|nr:AbrB/MazE/SpoVT family DNA-binding domain-containing protein [Deltaproteobacteria bacterium]